MSVFVWGSNKHKQLIDQTGLHSYAPSQVASSLFDDQTPLEVAAGDQHALVLCESGDIYAFGGGQEGQLGNGQRWGTTSSHKVKGLEHETIFHVAAGAHTSFAITSAGCVYHWGLVHTEESEVQVDSVHEDVQAGQLTGTYIYSTYACYIMTAHKHTTRTYLCYYLSRSCTGSGCDGSARGPVQKRACRGSCPVWFAPLSTAACRHPPHAPRHCPREHRALDAVFRRCRRGVL
ncbi:hypothetical protein EON65_20405 [archaeon]|nr:MAG: hypothetical protein EON65_20405 [archaeon]